jgi:phosphatidylglycerophosphate synthase
LRPNQVSLLGIVFAGGAAGSLIAVPYASAPVQAALLVAAALGIQLRLLANMLDGLMAVEGGLKSATGDLFNEVPDRIADLLILVSAGYAATWTGWGGELGWAAGAAALLTAYMRLAGGALGATQHFIGPMAKQHRMALMTAGCLGSLIELGYGYEGRVLTVALVIVIAGALVTFARRLALVAGELKAR